ncbi:chitin deacetylase 1 isoform X1 [Bicyclus anynana]|uniref:Chitin deacetylase 1 isoform X1 n=1 Tax=Bicyclus anynana TaxID=110368 RepID=A0A6J1PBS1_BICAN|nr:chitin deacetylase 1 isoform X1 [Bicyclus anynana]
MARHPFLCLGVLLLAYTVINATRVKRQEEEGGDDVTAEQLCDGRPGDEYFRLTTDGDCREVVRCDQGGENSVTRLATVRCPGGLAFDIDRQTCDWKPHVKNCDKIEKPRKVMPILKTDEPICSEGKLACGSGDCMEKELFCNGKPDCKDESDENACTVELDPNRAPDCDTNQCRLPDCFCSADGTRIPGAIEPNQVPQMVTITFNGAVNVDNIDLYEQIFNGNRHNPNGCQIRGTFFVSHKYTNYAAVQELHRKGHEISVFSLTHKDDPQYWTSGSYDDWLAEMAGGRLIIERFANITDASIIGVRAPYLRVGGNKQFEMMADQYFVYDASITAPLGRVPIWPYTLYFRMPHKCNGNAHNCPSRSHPVWEMVMNELDRRDDPTFDESLPGCHVVDSCSNIQTGEQFARLLRHNFNRHYTTNRAPLGLHFHASWLKSKKEFRDELIKFIEEMLEKNDVYFTSLIQVIQWMQNPTELSQLRDFQEWKQDKCDVKGQPFCSLPNACPLTTRELPGETLRLFTCMECPNNYPWILDPTGEGFNVRK